MLPQRLGTLLRVPVIRKEPGKRVSLEKPQPTVITMYTAAWCSDCRRAKLFLSERGVAVQEVNIDQSPEAEALVIRVNQGRRKVPTFEMDGHYFSSSPFDPYQLADELQIPLNR